jgi:hypothetical protein
MASPGELVRRQLASVKRVLLALIGFLPTLQGEEH